jgi:hypothetical protein
MGTTDATGTYTNSGSWNGFVGTYLQTWAVGGVNAQPTLVFNVVAAAPTPAGPINSTLGPSSSGTLTWNANGSLGQLAGVDGFNAGNAATCAYQHDDLGRLSVSVRATPPLTAAVARLTAARPPTPPA